MVRLRFISRENDKAAITKPISRSFFTLASFFQSTNR